jgi:1-deoxy-D-xylulose-5-phosphate synthase
VVGTDGPTHHGTADIAYLRQWPGIEVIAPADAAELRSAIGYALAADRPVAVRYAKDRIPPQDLGGGPVQRGRAAVLREGADGCILACGATAVAAVAAGDLLAARGLRPTVISARFAKPLDAELICRQARSQPWMLIAEDHSLIGGFSSAVMELLADTGIQAPRIRRLGIPDAFVRHAPRKRLLADLRLDAEGLAAAAAALAGRPASRTARHVAP